MTAAPSRTLFRRRATWNAELIGARQSGGAGQIHPAVLIGCQRGEGAYQRLREQLHSWGATKVQDPGAENLAFSGRQRSDRRSWGCPLVLAILRPVAARGAG